MPGVHYAENALGALCVADFLGVPFAQAGAALAAFQGVDRRFSLRGEAGRRPGRRRLRAPPDRAGRDDRGGAPARPAPAGRVPAAPLHADARSPRRLRAGAGRRRRGLPDRRLRGGRGADRRAPTRRALLATFPAGAPGAPRRARPARRPRWRARRVPAIWCSASAPATSPPCRASCWRRSARRGRLRVRAERERRVTSEPSRERGTITVEHPPRPAPASSGAATTGESLWRARRSSSGWRSALRAVGRRSWPLVGKALVVVAFVAGAVCGRAAGGAARDRLAALRRPRDPRSAPTTHVSSDEIRAAGRGRRSAIACWPSTPTPWRRALATHPWILSARVRRELPSTLAIEVTERRAVASALLGRALPARRGRPPVQARDASTRPTGCRSSRASPATSTLPCAAPARRSSVRRWRSTPPTTTATRIAPSCRRSTSTRGPGSRWCCSKGAARSGSAGATSRPSSPSSIGSSRRSGRAARRRCRPSTSTARCPTASPSDGRRDGEGRQRGSDRRTEEAARACGGRQREVPPSGQACRGSDRGFTGGRRGLARG